MTAVPAGQAFTQFAADVQAGLTRPGQKELPSVYLYDSVGTALFEAITVLPEYGLTRADERIIQRNAEDIARYVPGETIVAELGSGTGRKTRFLLEAMSRKRRVAYYPIDVSRSALARCEAEMASAGSIAVVGCEKTYLDGLAEVASGRKGGERILVLFLGSTIGNFERDAAEAFLKSVRKLLRHGDSLLLGTDLEKPVTDLVLAYDDPLGVTGAFNLNLLARINRELDGRFDLRAFRHEARWVQRFRRIEMHLVSRGRQTVDIPGAGLTVGFENGESIWTECCHKFTPEEVDRLAERCGFRCAARWLDAEWPFAESLWTAA